MKTSHLIQYELRRCMPGIGIYILSLLGITVIIRALFNGSVAPMFPEILLFYGVQLILPAYLALLFQREFFGPEASFTFMMPVSLPQMLGIHLALSTVSCLVAGILGHWGFLVMGGPIGQQLRVSGVGGAIRNSLCLAALMMGYTGLFFIASLIRHLWPYRRFKTLVWIVGLGLSYYALTWLLSVGFKPFISPDTFITLDEGQLSLVQAADDTPTLGLSYHLLTVSIMPCILIIAYIAQYLYIRFRLTVQYGS